MLGSHNKRHKAHLINLIGKRNNNTPNFALLIGAGASASSGVKTTRQMIAEWRRQSYEQSRSEDPFEDWLRKQDWYEDEEEYAILFERVYDQRSLRRIYVEECVRDAKPSWGYIYLANIIAHNYFNVVFTPNFDDLLNEACFLYADLRPMVSAHDSAVSDIRVTSARPKIIKLHGDFLYDSIKNTVRETERLEDNMREKFLQFAREYGLVVVGYGGNDRSIMDILDTLLRGGGYLPSGLYWCSREKNEPSKKLDRLMRRDCAYWVEIEGFDEFVAELHEALGLRLPDAVRDPYRATTMKLNSFILPREAAKHPVIESHVRELEEQVRKFEKFVSGKVPREDFDRLVPYSFLADREYQERDYPSASVYYEKSLIDNPNDLDVMRRLALSYYFSVRAGEAREVSDRMIRLAPSNYVGYLTKAMVSPRTAPEEDIALITEALKYTPEKSLERARVLTDRSNAHLLADHWPQAIADADEALKINPETYTAVVNRCIAVKKMGRADEADAVLQETLPKIESNYLRAGAFAVLGDKASMLKELRAAIKEDRRFRVTAIVDPDFAAYREDPDFRELVQKQ